ncbi:unnamed protein product [Caenorhabditis sp. 36 PRJEB53466]|nr:unnamed protein product [Caenorhabditis sp. 36 PRJEB53466]
MLDEDGIPQFIPVLHTCSCLSIPINLLAIYCILLKSSNNMRKYKWYLLNVQIWIFLTDLILFVLIAPRFYFPLIAGTTNGLFYAIGMPYEAQTIIGFGTGVGMISACTQAIQYRHSQILPPSSLMARKPRLRTLLNTVRYLLFCQISVPAVLTEPRNQLEGKMRVADKFPTHPELFFDSSVYLLQESPSFVVVPGALVIFYVFVELSFYITQSFRQLNKRVSHMSERTKRMQKTYFVYVCIQVLVPCCFCLIPISFLCFAILSGYQVQLCNDVAVLMFGLHGIVATLVMLPLYQPYRTFCKQFFFLMDSLFPHERQERAGCGYISLNPIEYGCTRQYSIAATQWLVHIGLSETNGFSQLRVSTNSLKELEYCQVEMEVQCPKYLPQRMLYWHVFDIQRNAFCIPFPDEDVENREGFDPEKAKPTRGYPTSRKGKGSYLRLIVSKRLTNIPGKDIWRIRNYQFPYADLILKVGHQELYVNKRMLAATSRFFMYICGEGRTKTMNKWEVLHVIDVDFEDLYDIVGYVYYDWKFGIERALEMQMIAEQFGVMMQSNNAEDFEGRTALDYVTKFCFDRNVYKDESSNWRMIRDAKEGSVSTISVFESERRSTLHDNDIHMYEPSSPTPTVSTLNNSLASSFSSSSSSTSSIIDVGGPMIVDDGLRPSSSNEHMEVEPAELSPSRSFSPPPPMPDDLVIATKQGKFSFSFAMNLSDNWSRGHKEDISTEFGRWVLYLYRRSLNGQDFLALGAYLHEVDLYPQVAFDTEFRIQAHGENKKPARKILKHVFSVERNAYGYPNFMLWADVMHMAGDNETLPFDVHLICKLTTAPLPPMEYDMFPGIKDVLVSVDDYTIPVAKAVLSDASSVFRDAFNQGFIVDRTRIHRIAHISYDMFMMLLDIIYHRVCTIPVELQEPLMEQALRFKMWSVMDHICREITKRESLTEREANRIGRRWDSKLIWYSWCNRQLFIEVDRTESLIKTKHRPETEEAVRFPFKS